ncbi:hypothetical protein ACW9KT_21790 [Hymenobacter sp. HD11105]
MPSLSRVVIGCWLVSLVLIGLTLATPLEFTPLTLGNLPRWGAWGLAFPACHLLGQHATRFRVIWRVLPWLLWGPLVVVQALWLVLALPTATTWSPILEPTLSVFARPQQWQTTRVLFQRSEQVVAMQQLGPQALYPREFRTAIHTPLVPGLQWVTSLNAPQRLDASWQVVDLPTLRTNTYLRRRVLRLSQDSAVHRSLRPWEQAFARRRAKAVWVDPSAP